MSARALFAVMAFLAVVVSADPIKMARRVCVMKLARSVHIFQRAFDQDQTEILDETNRVVNKMQEPASSEFKKQNIGEVVFTDPQDTEWCCRSADPADQNNNQLHCMRSAKQDTCLAVQHKCSFSDHQFDLKGAQLKYKQFACSDLKTQTKSKDGVFSKTRAWSHSHDVIYRRGHMSVCCRRGKADKSSTDGDVYQCGPLVESKKTKLINWEKRAEVLDLEAGDASAAYSNAINQLNEKEEDYPIALGDIFQEAFDSEQCANMLQRSNESPDEVALIFLTMTDMMIQQTHRSFQGKKQDPDNLLTKTLLRSYLRFHLSIHKNESKTDTLSKFSKWWNDEKGVEPLPRVFPDPAPAGQQLTISCVKADMLFSQDIERMEANTHRNEVVKGRIMTGVHAVTSVIKFAMQTGAKVAGTAAGVAAAGASFGAAAPMIGVAGPAAGAAAGLLADAVFGTVEKGIEKFIERNHAIAKLRREARSAILQGYQSSLYSENSYKPTGCTPVVKSYLDVVYKYLTADDATTVRWQAKCRKCISNLRRNRISDYGHALRLLQRMQGFRQSVYAEIDSWWKGFKKFGQEFLLENLERLPELRNILAEAATSFSEDQKLEALSQNIESLRQSLEAAKAGEGKK